MNVVVPLVRIGTPILNEQFTTNSQEYGFDVTSSGIVRVDTVYSSGRSHGGGVLSALLFARDRLLATAEQSEEGDPLRIAKRMFETFLPEGSDRLRFSRLWGYGNNVAVAVTHFARTASQFR